MSSHPTSASQIPGRRTKKPMNGHRRAARYAARPFRPQTERMEDRTLLATMIWSNSGGGDWDIASNWVNQANSSDHHVPNSSDNAEINISGVAVTHTSSTSDSVNSLTTMSGTTLSLSNGTLSIAAASTLSGNLTISGGTLSGTGTLTASGAITWTGGTMSGTGTTDAQGGLTLGGTVANTFYGETLSGRTLNNFEAATLAGTYADSGLFLGGGAVLDNEAGRPASTSPTTRRSGPTAAAPAAG